MKTNNTVHQKTGHETKLAISFYYKLPIHLLYLQKFLTNLKQQTL